MIPPAQPQPYTPARCGECRAPATRPGGNRGRGPYTIKPWDHDPDCKTGQVVLLATVRVSRDGAVHWRGPWRPSGEPWTWLVGYLAKHKTGTARWWYVIANHQGTSPLFPSRRAALLAMLRNPNTRRRP